MNVLEGVNPLSGLFGGGQTMSQSAESQQRNLAAMTQNVYAANRAAAFGPDEIARTAKYFESLGLSKTTIRKAMTRACFEVLKNG